MSSPCASQGDTRTTPECFDESYADCPSAPHDLAESLELPCLEDLDQAEREAEEDNDTEKVKKLKEENENLKLKLTLKETEVEGLKQTIGTLKDNTLTPELLNDSEIPKMMEYSTGFTYERFNQLCTLFDIPNDPHTTQQNVPIKYNGNEIVEIPLRRQLLFVLMKLRNNEDMKNLAFRFNISTQNASVVFNAWIDYMFDILGEIPIWPTRAVIAENMPPEFKSSYPSTFAILDVAKLKIDRPTSSEIESESYSNSKSTDTLKSLVACDPRGAVIFSSYVFAGSLSDKEIFQKCGIIPLLKQLIEVGYLQRGDGIMADNGFLKEEDLTALGLQLNMPGVDVLTKKRIAKHGMQIQLAIAKIKKFKIVSGRMPHTRIYTRNINQIWYVVSMLSNFQPHIM